MKKDVDDYLHEGIYGTKQLNPAERKEYLGSLRERVVLALTKGEVMKGKGLSQLDQLMKDNKEAKVLLNGNMDFRYFKNYKKIAKKNKTPYTTVNNKSATTEYGLIFTYDHAVDIEDIYLKEEAQQENAKTEKKSFFRSLFGR